MLLKGAGGCFFVAAMCRWYLLAVIFVAELDIYQLPVVDLSTAIKGRSQRLADKERQS